MGSSRTALKLITFDVNNTLIKSRLSIGELYNQTAVKHGVNCSTQTLDCEFKKTFRAFNKIHPHYGQTTGMSSQNWWYTVVKRTFISSGYHDSCVLEKIAAELYENFTLPSYWQIYPDVIPALQQLTSDKVCLGVVSNFDKRLKVTLENLGLLEFFDFMVCPDTCGSSKPDSMIYQEALTLANVSSVSTAHIGDNIVQDYLPAQALGISAYLLIRDDSSRHDVLNNKSVNPSHVLKDMSELLMN